MVLGAPPNGSRLSCGRLVRRRKGVGRQSVPARAQHSASLKAITARQLQALVRPPPPRRSLALTRPGPDAGMTALPNATPTPVDGRAGEAGSARGSTEPLTRNGL